MAKFEVEFLDGKTVVKTTDTPGDAKTQARAEREREMPADTPRSAPEVKIKRVTRLDADEPRTAAGRPGKG